MAFHLPTHNNNVINQTVIIIGARTAKPGRRSEENLSPKVKRCGAKEMPEIKR